jgi:3-hexulose-6-phosphate synthase
MVVTTMKTHLTINFACADFLEAEIAFKAGADLVTVMGAVDDETIKVPWKQQKYGRKVVVDTIELKTEYKELK